MKTLNEIRAAIEATKTRGAWAKGVKVYALEILDTVAERSEYEGHEPQTMEELTDYMLNGARDWQKPNDLYKAWSVASWGGSYLIYNGDICERLCSPSEQKKTHNGEKEPNSREQWLDTQARALYQAGEIIRRTARA